MKNQISIYGRCLLFCTICLFSLQLKAQIQISGVITSQEDGLTLPGVTVAIKGSTEGDISDYDGTFSLTVPSEESILLFTYVGMASQEVVVGDRRNFNIVMESDALNIDEIVVVGYGVQKKENLSGAVDRVDLEQLESRPVANISQGLQGASPNLNIDFNSGAPDQSAKINIRGFTSINGGQPLILIDGVAADPQELNRLSPTDVENISVLKDASSAAIYGARAAFGVILITTKLGSKEGVNVSYNANLTSGSPTVLPDKVTDPYIYLRLRETSTDNTPWDNQNYSDERYAWAKERSDNPSGTEPVRMNPTNEKLWEYMGNKDWTRHFLNNSTFSQNHALSVDGKSNRLKYFLSGSYNRNSGAISLANDFYDRYTLRGKLNVEINDWLQVGNNTYLTSTKRENPSQFSLFSLYTFHPTDWDENPDGSWANSGAGRMAARIKDGGTTTDLYNSFQTTFTSELKLVPELLKLNADFTVRRGNQDHNSYETKYLIGYGPDDIREEGNNAGSRWAQNGTYNVFNIYGTLSKQLDAHNVSVVAGFNQEDFRSNSTYIHRDGIISASLPTVQLATGDATVSERVRTWAVRGLFGRINYTYADKYILEFNGRYDGSSRFPSNKRWGFFPSASVAWRLDKEAFMSGITGTINLLKLRASYGSLGNQFVSEYGYIPTMTASLGRYIIGDKIPQRVLAPQLVSPNYTWEDVRTMNVGVDVGILEDKIQFSADAFKRQTLGMLTRGKDLPDVLGASEPDENSADLETLGWEVSLGYRNSFEINGRALGFSAKAVLSDSRSKITRFENPSKLLTQYYVGQQLGEIWGLENNGLFSNEAEIDALDQSSLIPWGALKIVPGWPKYVDQDGNGKIEKGSTTDDPKDLKVIGNSLPRYRYGFNLSFDYAGFDLSTFWQGVGKRDYYPLDYLYWGFYQQPYAGGYTHLLDFYRGANDSETNIAKHSKSYINAGLASANTDAKFPILQAWLADRNLGERIDKSKGLAIPQSDYLLNAAYLRVKNITLGYTLPTNIANRMLISRLRVFLSADNLFEWSGVKKYFDPESITDAVQRVDPTANISRGTGKGYVYPFQRRYAIGVNVNF